MRNSWKIARLLAIATLTTLAGLLLGSVAGGALHSSSKERPTDSEQINADTRLKVIDGKTTVGFVLRGALSEPPKVVDGVTRDSFYPDPGFSVRNDAGERVGYFVPDYGFMTPEEASAFQADPSRFEPNAIPAPADAVLPDGFGDETPTG